MASIIFFFQRKSILYCSIVNGNVANIYLFVYSMRRKKAHRASAGILNCMEMYILLQRELFLHCVAAVAHMEVIRCVATLKRVCYTH